MATTVERALSRHRLVALDTSVLIYYLEASPTFGKAANAVLRAVARARVAAIASELVLLELLVAPLRKQLQDAADEIELTLTHFPNLTLAPITRSVLLRAAEIRARYELRTPDAIMLATALESGATLAITNDKTWQKVNECEILLLRDVQA